MTKPKLLDVVALMKELPEKKLVKGQVGTVVEKLADGVYEVEFANRHGRTIAMCALLESDLMALHYELKVV